MLKIIHNQLGILIAPFIFVAALTGLLYGLTPQFENFIYKEHIIAQHLPNQKSHLISEQIQASLAVLPKEAQIFAVRTPTTINHTTRIIYQVSTHPNQTFAIFVNPYNLHIQGQLAVYGASGVLPLRTFLDQLHRSLLLGEYGRIYSEFAASWLGFFALTGCLQWWIRHRKQDVGKQGYLIKWHYVIGLSILPMLLFFSVTGLTWSKWTGENIAQIRHLINSDTPSLKRSLQATMPQMTDLHAEHHMHMVKDEIQQLNLKYFDRILNIAHQNGLNAQALQIKPSYRQDQAWSIEEINHRWPIQVDAFAVDMSNDHIIDRLSFQDFPLSAKLTRWGVDFHIGVLFGWINQLLLVLAAAFLLVLLTCVYFTWWRYQRPYQTLQKFNIDILEFWHKWHVYQKTIFFILLFLLYFIIPVWVVSVLILQLVVFLYYQLSKS